MTPGRAVASTASLYRIRSMRPLPALSGVSGRDMRPTRGVAAFVKAIRSPLLIVNVNVPYPKGVAREPDGHILTRVKLMHPVPAVEAGTVGGDAGADEGPDGGGV